MTAAVTNVRRLFGVLAGGVLVFGPAAILAPVATAQPDPAAPDCSAANVASTVSAATAAEGAYLMAHPQHNEALSGISSQPPEQAQGAYDAYFAQNPQAKDDLVAIHQPVSALSEQCGFNVTPTLVADAVATRPSPTPAGIDTPNLNQNEVDTPAGVDPPS